MPLFFLARLEVESCDKHVPKGTQVKEAGQGSGRWGRCCIALETRRNTAGAVLLAPGALAQVYGERWWPAALSLRRLPRKPGGQLSSYKTAGRKAFAAQIWGPGGYK